LFVSHGLPLSFKQEEIRCWRNRAAIEVLCGNLFPFYEEENINDTLEDHSMSSSIFESDSELGETSNYIRSKRRVSSELKKYLTAEH
jgi:hypothetical protein